ncbi:hypothetical protein Pint_13174 [Pistacia integerrima]|uniref:Uncharacterized protein n=1 Tax=Pistacia integerrima TaxID=434235 RepID=A0ACC0YAH3_9ROSI|nr:hypothetical protein Pint_13174 [Pistacia integerrima]
MENRFKLRISRMFRASFGSCRSRNISDVIEKAVFSPQKHKNFHMIEPLSPKARPFPSICKPRCPEATNMIVDHGCFDTLPRRKVSEQYSPFVLAASDGRMCPPASPISPLNPFYHEYKQFGFKEKEKDSSKNKKKKRSHVKKTMMMKEKMRLRRFSLQEVSLQTPLMSLSRHQRSRRKKRGTRRQRAASKSNDQIGMLPLSEGKVKDSFAVVKSSSDPYNDFRTSMVEMIVEKHIFAAKDLEQLLQCFLSLNSYHHHRIILEVFTEIWEALFTL